MIAAAAKLRKPKLADGDAEEATVFVSTSAFATVKSAAFGAVTPVTLLFLTTVEIAVAMAAPLAVVAVVGFLPLKVDCMVAVKVTLAARREAIDVTVAPGRNLIVPVVVVKPFALPYASSYVFLTTPL